MRALPRQLSQPQARLPLPPAVTRAVQAQPFSEMPGSGVGEGVLLEGEGKGRGMGEGLGGLGII